MNSHEMPVVFDSDGIRLEGALHTGTSNLAAVVLHPHPHYGGDMNSHVVTTLCSTLAAEGATTLRFNMRGVGGSAGAYDEGRGEATDARSAMAHLREHALGVSLLLAGYSFGAAVATSIASDHEISALVLVSLPAQAAARPLPAHVPTLIITGARDAVAPPEAVRALASPTREVVIVDGVDHFWFPGADLLAEEVRSFLRNLQRDQ